MDMIHEWNLSEWTSKNMEAGAKKIRRMQKN